MKHYFFLLLAISLFLSLPVKAEDYLISTPQTSLLLSGNKGEKLYFQYYGSYIDSEKDVYNSGTEMRAGISGVWYKLCYRTSYTSNPLRWEYVIGIIV